MELEGTVLHKSFVFAKRIVKLYKHLLAQGQPRALADQLLRSGTSICANMEEATGGFSRRDFAAKCGIAYKEARETHYLAAPAQRNRMPGFSPGRIIND